MKWFRFWTDTLDDVKILKLSDYEYRMWTYLLAFACESDSMSGECHCDVKSMSLRCRTQVNHFLKAIETFQKLGLVTINQNGFIEITNWSKRQFKSDNVTERIKRYRQGKAKRNVSCNNIETSPDTDTDTERKKYIKKEKIEFQENHFVNIPDALMEKWKSIAPGISIRQEITKAEAWVLSNPKLKKSNWSRFLTNWIVRAQDKAHNVGGTNGDRPSGRRMDRDRLQQGIIPKEYTGDGPRPEVSAETVKASLERVRQFTDGIGIGGADPSNTPRHGGKAAEA